MSNLNLLADWLKEKQADAAFITSTENVFYLSGFHSDPHERLLAVLAFPADEPILICPQMEVPDAKQAGWPYEIIGILDTQNPWERVHEALKKRNVSIQTLAVEKEHLTMERLEGLNSILGQPSYISAEEKMRQLRMVKSESELAIIREACRLADYAIKIGTEEIAEGKTEMEILAALEYQLKKEGVSEMSFATMVLTGENAASPHGVPGQTKVKKGDLVLFDLGVVVDGYCSDITRTVAYGQISDEQREIYETVLEAQKAAVAACRPGVTCAEVDLTARNIIRDKGYGDYFPHRLGHGLGISVHEYPSLTEVNELKLQKGMVFTIEPGIYVPKKAGVRIEDDLYVTENGVEILTKFPKELITL